jgi:hypothetical protein
MSLEEDGEDVDDSATVPALIRHVAGEPSLVRAILDDD